jgi:hypothetical protein
MSTAVWQITGLAAFAGALFGAGAWILVQRRDPPEKRESHRRLRVNGRGRLGDGIVMDVAPNVIYYAYSVSGVEYRASQDVTHLSEFLPSDPDRLIGPVTLKYSPRNPANSIVLCEVWSGLRTSHKEIVSQ